MLALFRRRLVDDAHDAWKWGSVRFIALGGAIQGVLVAMPHRMDDYLPDWLMQGLSGFALFCMIAAGVARITIPKDGDSK